MIKKLNNIQNDLFYNLFSVNVAEDYQLDSLYYLFLS